MCCRPLRACATSLVLEPFKGAVPRVLWGAFKHHAGFCASCVDVTWYGDTNTSVRLCLSVEFTALLIESGSGNGPSAGSAPRATRLNR
jgi:hypothetical protein